MHPRPLFGEHKLAAREIPARFRKQDRDLKGNGDVAIEVRTPPGCVIHYCPAVEAVPAPGLHLATIVLAERSARRHCAKLAFIGRGVARSVEIARIASCGNGKATYDNGLT